LFSSNVSADTVEQVLHGPTGSGLHNHGEALKALRVVRSLLDHSNQLDYPENPGPGSPQPLREEDIAIITPFNSQVVRLRKVFREHGLYGVNIGPLEAFQGLESRFLIICTTRTRTDRKIIEHDQALRLGLIGEKKRFNVALTRAKEGLIVIGNPALLGAGPVRDETWRAFLSFCARNGCWEPAPGQPDKPKNARYERDAREGLRSGDNEPGEAADHGSVEARQDPSYWERKLAGLASEDSSSAKVGNEADEKDPRLEGYVSSLEYALLYDEKVRSTSTSNGETTSHGTRQLGGGQADDAYDAAMWVSGTAAEEVLRGWEERA
jgi:helicase MOV-10